MPDMEWLPNPPDGTQICLGFDGSESDDFTVIQAETRDGFSFTPMYGPDARPTIWNPAEWGGQIPRHEVKAAVDELVTRFRIRLAYCDPPDWRTEIWEWDQMAGGQGVFMEWATYRAQPMFAAIKRFETDLSQRRITHDGCPLATLSVRNAKKVAKPNQRYMLGKPSQHQKIDPAMGRILAHEACADAFTAGWPEHDTSAPARLRRFGR